MTYISDPITPEPSTDQRLGPDVDLPFDAYREIHKGIRWALFHTTMQAGSTEGSDEIEVEELLASCTDLIDLLHLHHEHEDRYVDPLLQEHLPSLAGLVNGQHVDVEVGLLHLADTGRRIASASTLARGVLVHRLYLDLTKFTASYLEHQLVEERVVMPAICERFPVSRLHEIEAELRASIPPPVMAETMQVMLPAMHAGERAEMLGGMSMAPAEVFAVFRRAAERALTPAQFAVVAERIGLN